MADDYTPTTDGARLAEINARWQAAFRDFGPWMYLKEGSWGGKSAVADGAGHPLAFTGEGEQADADGEFMAHSLDDVRWLAETLAERDAVITAQAAVIEAISNRHRPVTGQGRFYGDKDGQVCVEDRQDWPCGIARALASAPSVSLDAVKAEAAAEQREKDAEVAELHGNHTSIPSGWQVAKTVAAAIRSGVTR